MCDETWSPSLYQTNSLNSCVEGEHEPIEDDDDGDMYNANQYTWQLLSVSLHRAPNIGFGIAISGGRDNPLFTSGDPVVAISDVVTNGPAWGLLQLNDRILSANNISFDNIDYSTAVDIIKNTDHLNMIVKRRVAMPMLEFEQRTLKFTLSKSRKKDDFGIVVGCKYYIKEIRNPKLAEKDPGLREGDSLLRINGQSLEGATLDEVNKWLERSRDKLCLVIQRDVRRGTSRWPSQNTVYERVGGSVSATPRHSPSPMLQHVPLSPRTSSSHEYVNSPKFRTDVSVERRVSSPANSQASNNLTTASITNGMGSSSGGSAAAHEYDYYMRQQSAKIESNGIRNVVFRKIGGSVGVRVIGGNEVGIFVSAVASDSPAAMHGVCCGDRILEVNGRNMRNVTRESAVQLLLGLDDRVSLKLEHARQEFEHVRANQMGDNFYIRSHFAKEKKNSPLELSVNDGDIFHVTDTLFGGTVGLWQAARVYSAAENKGEPVKGVIPNQTTAEHLAKEYRAIMEAKQAKCSSSSGGGGGTLLRRKFESKKSKGQTAKNGMLSDPTELSANIPLPAYERVALNTPSFHRPIVLFGPLADIARQQLLTQFSARFAQPDCDGGVIRLSSVDQVIASMKHCILDISIESVERLQLAQYAPIVVLIDVENRSRIRDIRKKANAPHVSSRKLADNAAQIKKFHSHLLSATIDATHENGWFEALRELIVHLQQRRLWMPEFPPNLPLEDVLLFPLPKEADVESLKSEYLDYSSTTTSRRDTDSLPRSLNGKQQAAQQYDEPPNNKYNWEHSLASSSTANEHHPSEFRMIPAGGTLPRRTACNGLTNTANNNALTTFIPTNGCSSTNITNHCVFNSTDNEPGGTAHRNATSPGYYHVKQLLDDESLYQDARLANEIANARLREEARLREGKARQEFQQQNGYRNEEQIEASPARRSMRSQMAPKATSNVYGDSTIRNKWGDETLMDATRRANGNDEHRRNGSASPANASIALTVASGSMIASKSPTPRLDENENGAKFDEDEPIVVEESTRMIGSEGGVIRCENSNVELRVPPGAIRPGEEHEIYVKVCREGESSPIDRSKGETLLSPLVMCGPQGLKFEKQCELRMPHNGVDIDGQWSFSLKTGEGGEWKHMDIDHNSTTIPNDDDNRFLKVPITHF